MYTAQENPYQKYKQQSVMTMTQGEMLTQLFDEVIKQVSGGVQFIGSGDYDASNQSLQKAQVILNYLRQSLDRRYPVSQGLDQLYEFFIHRVVQANIKKETAGLEEIIPMLQELRETFVVAGRTARMRG